MGQEDTVSMIGHWAAIAESVVGRKSILNKHNWRWWWTEDVNEATILASAVRDFLQAKGIPCHLCHPVWPGQVVPEPPQDQAYISIGIMHKGCFLKDTPNDLTKEQSQVRGLAVGKVTPGEEPTTC